MLKSFHLLSGINWYEINVYIARFVKWTLEKTICCKMDFIIKMLNLSSQQYLALSGNLKLDVQAGLVQ